ncbi:MFS transporter [Leifsonia sp. F6_8S_P_1B]|uniref:MFS transporter n=1 Tax=Leifsonia williamsii TaxID=3035919 RepID=A0ABT8K7F8_9MICO|nr:MFS transporter [Leifsonia williamsii]MDN4613324.1 MFS transporter [Leifsonia williamsii]
MRSPSTSSSSSSSSSLFGQRDFRLLLAGQTTSQLGAQVSGVAIPLLAVATLHASAFEVGLLGAASTIAFAVLGLPAGAWIDRVRRRPVLVASDLVRAVLLATIPLAWMLGVLSVWQLLVVSLLVGVARVFFDVGYRSYLPAVIGRDRVLAGNSSLEFVRASGQVAGPALGGVLVAALGAALVVLVQAVTFAVSAACLLGIRAREGRAGAAGAYVLPAQAETEERAASVSDTDGLVPETEEIRRPETRESSLPRGHAEPAEGAASVSGTAGGGRRSRMGADIAEGLRVVFHTRVLRATAVASAVSNFAFAVASAVNIVFLSRTLGLPPAVIGVVIAVGSVTVMIGAAFTTRLAGAVGSARIIWLSLAVTTPLSLATAFAQPGWWTLLVVVGIAAGELGQIVYAITNVSLRQQIVPDRLLGRVNATMQVVVMGLFPLGAIIGGVLGEVIGARWTVLAAGVLLLCCPILLGKALRGARDVEDVVEVAAG